MSSFEENLNRCLEPESLVSNFRQQEVLTILAGGFLPTIVEGRSKTAIEIRASGIPFTTHELYSVQHKFKGKLMSPSKTNNIRHSY